MITKSWVAISNMDEIEETIIAYWAIFKSSYWDRVEEAADTKYYERCKSV